MRRHIVWYKQAEQGGYSQQNERIMHISGIDQSKICPTHLTPRVIVASLPSGVWGCGNDTANGAAIDFAWSARKRQMEREDEHVDCTEQEGRQGRLGLYCQTIHSRGPPGHRAKHTHHSCFTSTRGNPPHRPEKWTTLCTKMRDKLKGLSLK